MKLKNLPQALLALVLIVAGLGLYVADWTVVAWICAVVGIVVAVWGGSASRGNVKVVRRRPR